MTQLTKTAANQSKIAQLERALTYTFDEVLRRGFFGTASIELSIQDGTIQYIRSKLERIEK
jgi:hypothetical protein